MNAGSTIFSRISEILERIRSGETITPEKVKQFASKRDVEEKILYCYVGSAKQVLPELISPIETGLSIKFRRIRIYRDSDFFFYKERFIPILIKNVQNKATQKAITHSK